MIRSNDDQLSDPDATKPAITFAQAVLSNWSEGEVPNVAAGYQIGLATWSSLDERALVDLEGWLQSGVKAAGRTKYVFGALRDDRTLFACVNALDGLDDFGRSDGRFWAHALVTDKPISESFDGSSPVEWFSELPFFQNLEAAVAAVTDDRGSLPQLQWVPSPPRALSSMPGLEDAVGLAWQFAYGNLATTPNRPIWKLPTAESKGWQMITEAYRVIDPERWGTLGIDTLFDGVRPEPQRRSYWAIGFTSLEASAECPRVARHSLDPVGRWVVALAEAGRWPIAMQGVRSARELQEVITKRTPYIGWTIRAPSGFLGEARPELSFAIREDLLATGIATSEVNLVIEGLNLLSPPEVGELWVLSRESGHFTSLTLGGLLALSGVGGSIHPAQLLKEKGASPICQAWALAASGEKMRSRDLPSGFAEALSELSTEFYADWTQWVITKTADCRPELVVPAIIPNTEREWERRVMETWRAARSQLHLNGTADLRSRWMDYLAKLKSTTADRIIAVLQNEIPDQDIDESQLSRISQRARKLVQIPSWSRNDRRNRGERSEQQ